MHTQPEPEEAQRTRGALSHKLHALFDSPEYNLNEVRDLYFPRLFEILCMNAVVLLNLGVVSHIGQDAVNAIGMIDPIHMIIQYTYIACGLTATVFASQYIGAGKPDMANRSFVQLMRMVLIFSFIISIALVLVRKPLLLLLYRNATETALSYASVYFVGMIGSGPLYAVASLTNGLLRSIGRPGSAMLISLLLNISMFLFNVLFVRVLDMGIIGMVYSVFLARVITALLVLRLISFRSRVVDLNWRKNLPRDGALQKRLLAVSLPFVCENILFTSGKLFVQMIAVQLGSVAASINTINTALMGVAQSAGSGVADISVNITGRCFGRGDVFSGRRYTHVLHLSASFVNLIVLLLTLALFPAIMRLYRITEVSVSHAILINLLIIGIANVVVWPRAFLVPSCLKSAGDVRYTTVVAIVTMWTIRVLGAYLISITCGLGVVGIWIAMAIEWTVRAVVYSLRLRGDLWHRHHLI